MSDWAEVDRAVALTHDAPEVTLLHCVSLYPTPTELANLSVIPRMRERYGLAVGWSDHTTDIEAGVIAVALGSSVIEKHLTLDKRCPGRIIRHPPIQTNSVHMSLRSERPRVMLGTAEKRRVEGEDEVALAARRSHHAARDLAAGEVLRRRTPSSCGQASGVPASSSIEGRRLLVSVCAGDPIEEESLAPSRAWTTEQKERKGARSSQAPDCDRARASRFGTATSQEHETGWRSSTRRALGSARPSSGSGPDRRIDGRRQA